MCSRLSVICHCLNISHIDLVTAIVDKIWNGSQTLMCWKLGPQHMALLEVAQAFRGRDRSDGKKLGPRRCVLDEEPWLLVLFLLFASWPSGLGQFTVLNTSPGWNAALLSWKQLKQLTTEWSLWHCKAKHTSPPLWYLSGIFHDTRKLTNKILASFLLGQILWQGSPWGGRTVLIYFPVIIHCCGKPRQGLEASHPVERREGPCLPATTCCVFSLTIQGPCIGTTYTQVGPLSSTNILTSPTDLSDTDGFSSEPFSLDDTKHPKPLHRPRHSRKAFLTS